MSLLLYRQTNFAIRQTKCSSFLVPIRKRRNFDYSLGMGRSISSEDVKSSSKVEDTVKRLKELRLDETVSSKVVTAAKPSLRSRVLEEIKHYYHGFRLLFLDIRVSSGFIFQLIRGHSLSRRESKLLVRTVSDVFRLVPFSVFIIVPFMEFLLPVALKLFPGMLPSTFTSSSEKASKMVRTLNAKLEYAKFLQKTLDEMSVQTSAAQRSSQSAKDFAEFFNRLKSGVEVSNEEIIKFSKFFEDEITLNNMTRNQLIAICRLLELTPFGNSNFLRFQIEMKLRQLKVDDRMIDSEGLDNLNVSELQSACKERGMRALGLSEANLKKQLFEWLSLSLNAKIPSTLLLLSRTLYLPNQLDTTAQIAATISALPVSAATQTKATIGEREGKIENITRLKVIQEEQRRIKEERLEKSDEKVEVTKVEVTKVEEDENAITPKVLKLSQEDLDNLTTVIKARNKLEDQKDSLRDIKKELIDYQEDIQDLSNLEPEEVKESEAAKRLYAKINIMVGKADRVLSSLHTKEKEIQGQSEEADKFSEDDNLVSVQELMNSFKTITLEKLDESKIEQISHILEKMDVDADGVINVDHVLKVIELLGPHQLNLSDRQLQQILEMLEKEERLDATLDKDLTLQEPEEHIKELFEDKKKN